MFVGAANMALQYFAHKGFSLPRNENPSDFLLDVTMGNVSFRPQRLVLREHGYGRGIGDGKGEGRRTRGHGKGRRLGHGEQVQQPDCSFASLF